MLRTLVRSLSLVAILTGTAAAATGEPPAATNKVQTHKTAKKKVVKKANKKKAARKTTHKAKAKKATKSGKAAKDRMPAESPAR